MIKVASLPVEEVSSGDYPELIELWEASVRATHSFLTEDDIRFYRSLILNSYFALVDLKCVRNARGRILGFIGTTPEKIEMLFIHPDARGMGIGRQLVRYAVDVLNIKRVDVNEQNDQAVGFYYAVGFRLGKRSPIDGMGKPYPMLHMLIDQDN